uniref:Uncharacterized protein LOC114345280 n=1 Tax=Diabrotica virgifera virgifera TaxID=50390 RepID=A0A6P7GPS0_DIAVI
MLCRKQNIKSFKKSLKYCQQDNHNLGNNKNSYPNGKQNGASEGNSTAEAHNTNMEGRNTDLSEESDFDDNIADPDYQNDEASYPESTDDSSDSSANTGHDSNNENYPQQVIQEEHWKGRPRKGRQRKYIGQTEEIRRTLKNTNKPYYISKRGLHVDSKQFIDYQCNCKEKCYTKINSKIRREIFEKYWNVGSYDLQTSLIIALVQENAVKRRKNHIQGSHLRFHSRTYTMNKFTVCRDMLCPTS